MAINNVHDTATYRMANGAQGDAEGVVVLGGVVQAAGIGSPTDPAWDGVAASASLISIMKACHARLVEIAANTGP